MGCSTNAARTGMEQTYTKFLRHICAVRFNTPSVMLLTELGLSSLKVFWWQHTLGVSNTPALLGLCSTLSCLTTSVMRFYGVSTIFAVLLLKAWLL